MFKRFINFVLKIIFYMALVMSLILVGVFSRFNKNSTSNKIIFENKSDIFVEKIYNHKEDNLLPLGKIFIGESVSKKNFTNEKIIIEISNPKGSIEISLGKNINLDGAKDFPDDYDGVFFTNKRINEVIELNYETLDNLIKDEPKKYFRIFDLESGRYKYYISLNKNKKVDFGKLYTIINNELGGANISGMSSPSPSRIFEQETILKQHSVLKAVRANQNDVKKYFDIEPDLLPKYFY